MKDSKKKKYTFEVHSAPISWLDYSEELKEIAEIAAKNSGKSINRYPDLSTSLTLERGFFLNYGFAIETLLKGLLIAENPNYVAEGKISQEISKGHNLTELAKKVSSIDFEKNELELFSILSDAIPYWGRYPIPKKHTKLSVKNTLTESVKTNLNELWFKIGKTLYEKIKFGWEGPSGVKTGPYLSSTFETDEDFSISLKKLQKLKESGEIEFGNVEIEKTISNIRY